MAAFDKKPSHTPPPKRRGSVYISYIFGRMNPPHEGHMHLIYQMIIESKTKGADPLILLGNGPAEGDPMDDPLPFELKKRIIIEQLTKLSISPDEYTIVQRIGSPIGHVMNFVGDISNIDDITITYFAGNKPPKNEKDKGDLTKMDWINPYLLTNLNTVKRVTINTEGIDPIDNGESLMSGTIVRKSVYVAHLAALQRGMNFEDEFVAWSNANPVIRDFYGDSARDVYEGILGPLSNIRDEHHIETIENYLLPTSEKTRSTQKRKASASASKGSHRKTKTSKGGKQKRNKSKVNKSKANKQKHYKTYRKLL